MKSLIESSLLVFFLAATNVACVRKSTASQADSIAALALQNDPAAPPATARTMYRRTEPAAPLNTSLAAHFAGKFSIGIALEPQYLGDWSALIASTFNRITAENAMKCAQIQPTEGHYAFERADQLANYARQQNMKMTGHALVWHQETPLWLVNGSPSEIASKLSDHINKVVTRYADVTDNWDVVNEAISDFPNHTYRDGGEGSRLFAALGERYIKDAFIFADQAVQRSGKAIDLYYNDYNLAMPGKRTKAIKLALDLRATGARVDGIGEQAHWSLDWPSTREIQLMIDDIVAAGLKVKISELDISVYPRDDWNNKIWESERPFDDALAQAQAKRYKEIFEVFVSNAEHITSVTLWGLSDDRTWLDQFPKPGRNNYPLLFNDLDQAKPAYFSLFEVH
jgi:endo-1,4-beta-xylanase